MHIHLHPLLCGLCISLLCITGLNETLADLVGVILMMNLADYWFGCALFEHEFDCLFLYLLFLCFIAHFLGGLVYLCALV